MTGTLQAPRASERHGSGPSPRQGLGAGAPRRWLLAVVLTSIAVNAALGIYALVVPGFGELQRNVLGTSACVTGAGVLTLACLPALERRRLLLLPLLGIFGSVAGFGFVVVVIWSHLGGVTAGKTIGSILAVAAVGVLGSILALVGLAPRYRAAFPAAVTLAAVLAATVVGGLWAEPSGTWYPRVLGVVAVLLAAVTLSIPILHRAGRAELAAGLALLDGGARYCPACGSPIPYPIGRDGTCDRCGARFRVEYVSRLPG